MNREIKLKNGLSRKLFYFNPTCEMAVANGHSSYMPPVRLRQFEIDLDTIPLWLAEPNDLVLVNKPVPAEHIAKLESLGFSVPKFITSCNGLENNEIDELNPWGWSLAAHKYFDPFKNKTATAWLENPMSRWDETHRSLLSRFTGLELIVKVMETLSGEYDLLDIPQAPTKVSTADEIRNLNEKTAFPVLLKTPWSASGRGLFKIEERNQLMQINSWITGKLKQQKFLMAEPFLNKVQDVSFHFWADQKGVRFLGSTFFKTDDTGQFIGCYTHQPMNEQFKRFQLDESLVQAQKVLQFSLDQMKINQRYHGPIGIDGLLFLNSGDVIKLHPCIEMNLRYTMGILNLRLRKQLHPESSGFWRIAYLDKNKWEELIQTQQESIIDGQLRKGTMALTPPPHEKGFMAYLELE